MILDDRKIRNIVEHFDVGELSKVVKALNSGFQSDNYHIRTNKGEYVLRFIYDSVRNVEYIMEVYDYFADHGIKTSKPVTTKEGTFSLLYEDNVIVVQSFIPGTYYETLDKIDSVLSFYGRELGRIHQVSIQMVKEKGEKRLSAKPWDTISYVIEASEEYMPENEYIRQQYEKWEHEINSLPKNQLTMAVIHGDVGPKDFLFKDGNYMGIIDFNAAHFDFLLFDIAPMMMYCDLYQPERKRQYYDFITAYLEEAPVTKAELKWLHLILRTRWLLQILYHQSRYEEGITKGSETGQVEENLNGVRDGENFLKITCKTSKEFYFKGLGEQEITSVTKPTTYE
ncbi:MAG: phosphotransferase [Promethearchaeota archaeon]